MGRNNKKHSVAATNESLWSHFVSFKSSSVFHWCVWTVAPTMCSMTVKHSLKWNRERCEVEERKRKKCELSTKYTSPTGIPEMLQCLCDVNTSTNWKNRVWGRLWALQQAHFMLSAVIISGISNWLNHQGTKWKLQTNSNFNYGLK